MSPRGPRPGALAGSPRRRTVVALVGLAACGAADAPGAGAPIASDLQLVGDIWRGEGLARAATIDVRDGVVVSVDGDPPTAPAAVLGLPDGAVALPGLHDAHTHTLAGSFVLDRVLLQTSSSMDGVAARVRSYAEAHPDEPWIVGYGWTPQLLGEPDGRLLDGDGRPVVLIAGSGHGAVVDPLAMALAGIDEDTPDPPGGRIVRDAETGAPTGLLLETAVRLVVPLALEDYDDAALAAGLEPQLQAMAAGGLTAITEILASPGVDLSRPWIYTDLDAAGRLPLRVHYLLPVEDVDDLDAIVEACGAWRSPRVRCAGGKLWVDGSIASAEGWTRDAWADGGHGSAAFDEAQLTALVAAAEDRGVPLRMHAMGDAAIDAALSALEAVSAEGGLGQPHVIDHAVLADAGLRSRMAGLGITASVQPTHRITADLSGWVDELASWGPGEPYPFAQLRDDGIPMAFGTDWPVWPTADAPVTLWAAVTDPRPGAVTPAEALTAMSRGSARAAGLGGGDAPHGCLELGCVADLTVFDADPLAVEPAALSELQTVTRLVGGVEHR